MMTLVMPPMHPNQRAVRDDPARFKVLAAGRRWGKSRLGALTCLAEAAQGRRAWWIAPSYPMATVGWRLLRQLAVQIPGAVIGQADRIVELPTHGTVQVRSADNPDSLRGEGLDYVVFDECSFVKHETWSEAIRPALADKKGRALFISTPKGRNWFWRLWQINEGEYRSWRFPTSDNPHIAQSEIEAAKKTMPERIFAQEFLAEFVEDGGGVFRRVNESATASLQFAAKPKAQYVFGVDWGKSNDWTVIAVVDVTTRELVNLERFNQIDYALQRGRLQALASKFKPQAIIAESNAMGEPIIEQLRRDGLPVIGFTTTSASKTLVVESLALAFEQGALTIIPDDVLIGELMAFETSRLPSGALRYSAPEGAHDDCVMALALAWHGASKPMARARVYN